MTISRGQMERQLRMGGGIMSLSKEGIGGGDYRGIDMGSRTGFGILKKISRGVKKAVKGVTKIAKSDVGKAALIAAGGYYLGGGQIPGLMKGSSSFGFLPQLKYGSAAGSGFGFGNILPNILNTVGASGLAEKAFTGGGITNILSSAITGGDKGGGSLLTKGLALAGLSTFLTDKFGMSPEQAEETLANPESRALYLRRYYKNLNPNADDKEVEDFVAANVAEYAVGGRVGFAEGPVLPPDPTQPVNPFGPKPGDFGIEEDIPIKMASNIENDKILEALFEKYLDMGLSPKDAAKAAQEEFDRMSMMKTEGRGLAALGGKMDTASDNAMQAAGVEGLPVRQNPKGVKELDLRKTGGFIPPVGIKEKADDIPAMLSNNEFVFTADAVRGAGGGDVNLGAQRMYDTMKRLEAGGKA